MLSQTDIELIDRYVQGALTADERTQVEQRMAHDGDFANEVGFVKDMQLAVKIVARTEMQAKLEAMSQQLVQPAPTKRYYMYSLAAAAIAASIALFFFWPYRDTEPSTSSKTTQQPYALNIIKPPVKEINIAPEGYHIDVAKGGSVRTCNGSVIAVPANAFVDAQGKPVTGTVDISFTQFEQPVDLFLAGVPLEIDSASKRIPFETAGMMDIVIKQNNQTVQLAKDKAVTIAYNDEDMSAYDLMYFDTKKQSWIPTEKEIESVNVKAKQKVITVKKPSFKPRLANTSKPRFILRSLDENKYPELKKYKAFSFEISENEKYFAKEVLNLQWEDAIINEDKKTGEFLVTLSNKQWKATYRTWLVLEPSDYVQAKADYASYLKTIELNGRDTSSKANAIREMLSAVSEEVSYKDTIKTYRYLKIRKTGLWCLGRKINFSQTQTYSIAFSELQQPVDIEYLVVVDKRYNTLLRYNKTSFNQLPLSLQNLKSVVGVTKNNQVVKVNIDAIKPDANNALLLPVTVLPTASKTREELLKLLG